MESITKEVSLENQLVIIGDEDIVLGFKAIGFKVYPVRDLIQEEIKTILDEIVASPCAICLVQDNIYQLAKDQINSYKGLLVPIFIPFAKDGSATLLENMIRDIRLRATGAF